VIQKTMEVIAGAVNTFLKNSDPQSERWVVLSNVTDHKGEMFKETENKVVMFLANIKHETTIGTYNPAVPARNHQYAALPPPLYISLMVLFFANFYNQTYAKGLEMISLVISFFQQNPMFTPENLPGLNEPPRRSSCPNSIGNATFIEKLTFEITNLDLIDVSYLMGIMGTHYLPSVYYKVRMTPFVGNAMQQEIPTARGIQAPGRPKPK
jgi:Pvc16 N-terminal domain